MRFSKLRLNCLFRVKIADGNLKHLIIAKAEKSEQIIFVEQERRSVCVNKIP
jgi:hypothetical protein